MTAVKERMKRMHDKRDRKPEDDRGTPGRKPYVPPAIEAEDTFELRALGCNRQAGQSLACNRSPSS